MAGDAPAIEEARTMIAAWLDGAIVDRQRLDAALGVAARHGDERLFDRLLAFLEQGQETERVLRASAAFPLPSRADAQLQLIGSPRLTDAELLFYVEQLLANPTTRGLAWTFLKANWDALRDRLITFGGRGAILSLGAFADAAVRADIASFFAGRDIAGAQRALQQTLERIDGRVGFASANSAVSRPGSCGRAPRPSRPTTDCAPLMHCSTRSRPAFTARSTTACSSIGSESRPRPGCTRWPICKVR